MQRVAGRARGSSREIVVPASIGNLGPGLDTLGLAVTLYLRVRVTAMIDDGRGRLACRFLDGPIGGPNRIERAFRALRSRGGASPSLHVDVQSEIPLRSGLGSSAAATVAGLRLRELVDGRMSGDQMLTAASKIEGHPDNAAPAIFGGVTSCCARADGSVHVTKWRWPDRWRIVVATPEIELATAVSRNALPAALPLGDAVFNMQHVALLLGALQSGRAEDLREALRDRAHQPFRQRLVPGLRRLLAVRHPDLIGVCLSGAGPSIAAFTTGRTTAVKEIFADAYRKERIACTVRTMRVHRPSTSFRAVPSIAEGREGDA
jgi:homoserine kinase